MKISTKIYLSSLFIIAVGYAILYGFSSYLQRQLLLQKEAQLLTQAQEIVQIIDKKIDFLKKETQFLASLDVMDDILAKDIDKRIEQILVKRSEAYERELSFIVIDTNNRIIAHTPGAPKLTIQPNTPPLFRTRHRLVIKEPIFTSFNPSKKLGYLLTLYPIRHLQTILPQKGEAFAWFSSRLIDFSVPAIPPSDLVEVKLTLPFPFNDITLHYAMLKQKAFATIERLMLAINVTFFIMLVMILLFTLIVSKEVIEPISSLARSVHTILTTKEFHSKLPTKRKDEIGELIDSFNNLFLQISQQMESLKQQSLHYESLLLGMIDFFNSITSTSNIQQTIALSIQELSKLLQTSRITFYKERPPLEEGFLLPLNIRSTFASSSKHFGYILIKDPKITVKNKSHFFDSISRLISLQLERISLLQELHSSLEAKSRFLSLISHDLRTPLSSILSLTQYLFKELSHSPHLQAIAKIEQAGYRLLSQINDLLEFSKLQNNKIFPTIKEFDLVTLIEEILMVIEPLAHDKELTIKKEITVQGTIKSDPKLIKAILYNLLSNAIKFSEHGTISITASRFADSIKITIEDEGHGIDPGDLQKIFDPFYSVDNSKNSIGLGLAIAKEYATLLQGKITMKSEGLGKGTVATFIFRPF